MSPVVDLQRRMRELGRIRLGDKGGRNGAQRRLEKFRLTSPSRGILEAAAKVYGGEVRDWNGAPDPPQFELYTDVDMLRVAIPPTDEPFSQWMEYWTAAGCQRRCDGEVATVAQSNGMRERPCVCKAQSIEGDDACKLTTRAPFILPDVPGIGVWRLESKGYNVATKLTGTLTYLAMQASQGVYIEAELRLEQKSKKVPGQPINRWVEPVLDTPNTTIGELMSGQGAMPGPALAAPHGRPALPSGADLPASSEFSMSEPAESSARWGNAPAPPSGERARRGFSAGDSAPAEQPEGVAPSGGRVEPSAPVGSGAEGSPATVMTEVESAPNDSNKNVITQKQIAHMMAVSNECGVSEADLKTIVADIAGVKSRKLIPVDRFDAVLTTIRNWAELKAMSDGEG